MKALVYTGTEEVIYRDEPRPADPAEGQVLLDIDACGLCGSDMHAYHGLDSRRIPPLILGHEAVGCLLYTSPSPRDQRGSRMPSSA